MKNIKTAADSGGGEMHIVRATSRAGQRKKDQIKKNTMAGTRCQF